MAGRETNLDHRILDDPGHNKAKIASRQSDSANSHANCFQESYWSRFLCMDQYLPAWSKISRSIFDA